MTEADASVLDDSAAEPDDQDEVHSTGELGAVVTAGELADAVSTAQRAVVSNPPLVAYTGVLLSASRGRLVVCGSDGDTTIAVRLQAPSASPGKLLVAPKPLSSWLVTHDRDVPVTLTAEGSDLLAAAGEARPYRFRGLSATFPEPRLARPSDSPGDLSGLADAVSAVRHAAAGSLRLRSSAAGLWVEATDNHRAAAQLIAGVSVGDLNAVVPIGPVTEMARHGVDWLGLDSRGRELRASFNGVWITTRLAAEEFPEVDQLLVALPSRSVTVDSAALRMSLRRLAAVADGAPASLTFGNGTVTIETHNGDVGDGSETVACTGDGSGFSCVVAVRYLTEGVSSHTSEQIRLHFSDPVRPLYVVNDVPTPDRLAIVMPVRL